MTKFELIPSSAVTICYTILQFQAKLLTLVRTRTCTLKYIISFLPTSWQNLKQAGVTISLFLWRLNLNNCPQNIVALNAAKLTISITNQTWVNYMI